MAVRSAPSPLVLSRRSVVAGCLSLLAAPPARADRPPLPSPPEGIDLVATGGPVIDFGFMAGAGEARRITDYRGHFLVLNIWAPWCLPCRDEMPSFDRLQQALSGLPVRVLPVSVDRRGFGEVEIFYRQLGIAALPILVGKAREVVDAVGEDRIPLTLLVDEEGREVFRHKGAMRWDDPAFIDALKARV